MIGALLGRLWQTHEAQQRGATIDGELSSILNDFDWAFAEGNFGKKHWHFSFSLPLLQEYKKANSSPT